ncbi:LysE family translocator [Catellatospora chokoriensis]|uniref:Threonine transporter RhtB n=1 Tax=Catellatospora chokoriensis TaxID=310353 RepID=A0A8J3K3W1_9ACTN|nr:LysE family translocator [Catellatospora chokoriensis]GIF91972.1 threonine transporter RhtB [Catellatospora chokoriensis]
MTVTSAVVSFALVAGVLTIIPGVDTALVLRVAVARGRRHAYATAAGICTGALVWGAAAAAGVSALLLASTTAYTVMRVVGGVYLAVIGALMLRDAWRSRRAGTAAQDAASATDATTPSPPTGSTWRAFGAGCLTNLLNPKVGLFYVAMLPQFLPDDVAALPMGLLLALVHDIEAMVWFALLIGGIGLARRWWSGDTATPARLRRTADALAGTLLLTLGLRLATDR